MSAASDLYSVGVILYELLTRRRPVRGRDRGRDRLQAGLRRAAPAERAEPGAAPVARRDRAACAREGSRQRYADAERVHRRARTRAARPAQLSRPWRSAQPTATAPPVSRRRWGRREPAPCCSRLPAGSATSTDPRRRAGAAGRWLLWALAALLVAALIAAALLLLLPGNGKVTVPRVVGQTEPAAAAALKARGLDSRRLARARSATFASGACDQRRRRPRGSVGKGELVSNRRPSPPGRPARPS